MAESTDANLERTSDLIHPEQPIRFAVARAAHARRATLDDAILLRLATDDDSLVAITAAFRDGRPRWRSHPSRAVAGDDMPATVQSPNAAETAKPIVGP